MALLHPISSIALLIFQQTHEGDEMFWYKTTILIADSYLKDVTLRDGKRKVQTFKTIQKCHVIGHCLWLPTHAESSPVVMILIHVNQNYYMTFVPNILHKIILYQRYYQNFCSISGVLQYGWIDFSVVWYKSVVFLCFCFISFPKFNSFYMK